MPAIIDSLNFPSYFSTTTKLPERFFLVWKNFTKLWFISLAPPRTFTRLHSWYRLSGLYEICKIL